MDASIVAKWFSNEILTDKALEVRNAFIEGKTELYAPEHLLYEVGNSIWKNKAISADDSAKAISDLINMEIELVRLNSDMASEAMLIARELSVSYYDALYIQLSKDLHLPLLSADTKLVSKADKHSIHLKDFQLS